VDIDLNYIGSVECEVMLAEKSKVEQAIEAVCSRLGIRIKRMPTEHAGGKWRLSFASSSGRPKSLELDMNFLLRTPLWRHAIMDSQSIGSLKLANVPVLDLAELAAGKLAALFSRSAARDLFDARNILRHPNINLNRVRLGFVVYGGANRRDWREISLRDISVNVNEVANQLTPLLRSELAPKRSQTISWGKRLVQECHELLSGLLPLRKNEMEFLYRLNEHGEIMSELLTQDVDMQEIISEHPALRWKAQNAREFRKGQTMSMFHTNENEDRK
jgi:hypothetical protein